MHLPSSLRRTATILSCAAAAALAAAPPASATAPPQPLPVAGKAFGFTGGIDPAMNGSQVADGVARVQLLNSTHYRDAIGWHWFVNSTNASNPVPAALTTPLGSSGVPSVEHLDETYTQLQAAGITMIIQVTDAPLWASKFAQCTDPIFALINFVLCSGYAGTTAAYHPTPANRPKFGQFAAAVAARYPGAIIEGWNEPDADAYANPASVNYKTSGSPSEVAEEQCVLYNAVKAVDPNRIVLSPAMGDLRDASFTQGYLHFVGTRTCHDGFSTHMYFGGSAAERAAALADRFAKLDAARDLYSDTSPIWVTETGSTVSGTSTEASQNIIVPESYDEMISMPEVHAVLIWALRDAPLPFVPYTTPGSTAYGFGLLRTDWTPKPAFCTLLARTSNTYSGC
ncbi:glycosyl hydrolase [Patulibacter medicamentivorans]|nr:glycosyl hydrolase [Patulibacter medicamentivorans]